MISLKEKMKMDENGMFTDWKPWIRPVNYLGNMGTFHSL